jgi:hypothetical protein
MNKFASPNNFLDKIDEVRAQVRDIFAAKVSPRKLADLSSESGTIIADALISPASTATSSDPTDAGFTGVFQGGDG